MSSCARAFTNWVSRGECSAVPQVGAPEPGRPGGASERTNGWIAERLRQAASLLTAQGANPFRISAYRRAGDAIEALDADVRSVAEVGGHTSLEAIQGVGPSIAGAVTEMLVTGRWGFLERLKGAADPEVLLCSVPGIGPSLAHRIQGHCNSTRWRRWRAQPMTGGCERCPASALAASPWFAVR